MDTKQIEQALHAAEQNMTDVLTMWLDGRRSDLILGEAIKDMRRDGLRLVKAARASLDAELLPRRQQPGGEQGVSVASYVSDAARAFDLTDYEAHCLAEMYEALPLQFLSFAQWLHARLIDRLALATPSHGSATPTTLTRDTCHAGAACCPGCGTCAGPAGAGVTGAAA